MSLALVSAFPSLSEAQIACSALVAAGFDAQLFDENFGRVMAIDLVGGFRVMAPDDEAQRAQRYLEELTAEGA